MSKVARVVYALYLSSNGVMACAQECDWSLRDPHLQDTGGIALAYDSARGVSVLYGGVIGTGVEQTWEWDGDHWDLRTDDCPDSQSSMVMVYDSNRQLTVLYTSQGDTWEWDGDAWAVRQNVGDAGLRTHFSMSFDSNRGVVVLFGGSDEEGHQLGDTWEFDGEMWKRVAFTGPGASGFNSMAYDSERRLTVLYGAPDRDETWEWDGLTWTLRDQDGAPGQRAPAAMVFNIGLRACVLFGGTKFSSDAWTWDGQRWAQLDTQIAPQERRNHGMAYDSVRGVVVLFGGLSYDGTVLNDTWELTCPSPCYPDLDGNGTLDLFDFLAFVNTFNAGAPGADCDGSKALDLFDFLCFVNAFNAGC